MNNKYYQIILNFLTKGGGILAKYNNKKIEFQLPLNGYNQRQINIIDIYNKPSCYIFRYRNDNELRISITKFIKLLKKENTLNEVILEFEKELLK